MPITARQNKEVGPWLFLSKILSCRKTQNTNTKQL